MKKFSKTTIILWIFSGIFLLPSISFLFESSFDAFFGGLVVAGILFFIGWKNRFPKTKDEKTSTHGLKSTFTVEQNEPYVRGYEVYKFKVAGVTFKNGRKSRQTILRKIKWGDEEFSGKSNFTLEKYDFEGEPAIGIYANGQQVGNVPRTELDYVLARFNDITHVSLDVYGGGKDEFGEDRNYGAMVYLHIKKPQIKE